MGTTLAGPVPHAGAELLAALRADLTAARYTTDRLTELLGPVAAGALHREQPLPALRALAGSADPAATLARLFVLGCPEPEATVQAALPRTGASGLVRAGLARSDGAGALVARCDLRPYGDEHRDWWVASDLTEVALGTVLPTDHVLGIGGASTTLASWTPRPRVSRALDLGTGCGVQALHLLGHADRVCATDLSERALGYARFTAGLNGLDLDLRAGSLLEPVAGETFDLIVSNPPFVITPRHPDLPRFEYRDGGQAGDAITAGLVRSVGEHLTPGGIAQFLGNWELTPGHDWAEKVAGWLEGTGLDAWVVQREVQDPAEYAETWARDGGHQPGTAEFQDWYAAWLDDFAHRGVTGIGFGVLTLQRPRAERAPFRDLVEVRHPVAAPTGPAVLAGLQARTWLAEHTDDDVLDTAWSVAGDVTEERIGAPGADDPALIQLRQGGGLRLVHPLDTVAAGLVGACDGDLTARQLLSGIAVLTEQPLEELTTGVLPTLRALVADGLLR